MPTTKPNELLLLSKNDIPFAEAQITIHQPSLKELGLIGEETFLMACQTLTITKSKVETEQDLSKMSNFDIFMQIMNDKSPESRVTQLAVRQLFILLFPLYKVSFTPRSIVFV